MYQQLKHIDIFKSLSNDALIEISKHVLGVTYPKGTILIHADKIEPYFYILQSGVARAYSDGENQQITFWFGESGSVLFSFNSYINNKPGYENIELLEDCALIQIKLADLFNLYHANIEIANWGRKIAEQELIATERRLIDRSFKGAAERYQDFSNHSPSLLKRVALKHIASYLGVTQVTLSRIRGGK
ncbi:cyclic nucleotide-binding domain-containing protein [Pedobacter petrophilus]|uniref:Cyclic nucleotide-binding domain-containing protein n=1 Tax=Pedobacter petrophilus TaxID=1908241 RepID=A0A7K0G0P8_9SPHI|nr:Crp/Fnr family transcriptional regulator [Pedobacter petrophilus]MRX77427.1 cyclic nucleotide-binding domain-containing protein [Pedobacter petrophilus]